MRCLFIHRRQKFVVPFSFTSVQLEQQQPFLSQMLYRNSRKATLAVHYDDDAETEERVLPH